MIIYLDTEFTDLKDPELISIGLVDQNGRTFYAEVDYRQDACSDFVREIVIPLLRKYPDRVEGTEYRVANELNDWLRYYENEAECVIASDYQGDWVLMRRLLDLVDPDDRVNFLSAKVIWNELDQDTIDAYWQMTGLPQHMALYDAQANRFAHIAFPKK